LVDANHTIMMNNKHTTEEGQSQRTTAANRNPGGTAGEVHASTEGLDSSRLFGSAQLEKVGGRMENMAELHSKIGDDGEFGGDVR